MYCSAASPRTLARAILFLHDEKSMKLLYRLVQYAVSTSTMLTASFSMGVLSSLPTLLFRYFMSPDYLLTIPVDFVPKDVKLTTSQSTGSKTSPQLVAQLDLRSIPEFSSQDYAIDLALQLPRSERNLDLGNFMIRSALSSISWHSSRMPDISTVNVVEKMGILPFSSHFIERLRRLVFAPWYIFRLMAEESSISVALWDSTDRPKLKYPFLLLTSPSELTVSSAELHFHIRLHGIRWVSQQYPISTTLMLSSTVFISELFSVALVIAWIYTQIYVKQSQYTYVKTERPAHSKDTVGSSNDSAKVQHQSSDQEDSRMNNVVGKPSEKTGVSKCPPEEHHNLSSSHHRFVNGSGDTRIPTTPKQVSNQECERRISNDISNIYEHDETTFLNSFNLYDEDRDDKQVSGYLTPAYED